MYFVTGLQETEILSEAHLQKHGSYKLCEGPYRNYEADTGFKERIGIISVRMGKVPQRRCRQRNGIGERLEEGMSD